MPSQTQNSSTATTYARSLIELAQKQDIAPQIGAELDQIQEVLQANPTFLAFLRNPGIGDEERTRVINKVKGVNRVVTSKPPGTIERE